MSVADSIMLLRLLTSCLKTTVFYICVSVKVSTKGKEIVYLDSIESFDVTNISVSFLKFLRLSVVRGECFLQPKDQVLVLTKFCFRATEPAMVH